ncbi:hypothetical protein [Paenirhodobacter sp.]|uniref:hypothetical protein n=1 Tax=Paenirhodobacter sp. TaxID=1965326 RepID=UPI003B3D3B49
MIDFSDGYYRSKPVVIGLKEVTFAPPAGLADKLLEVQVGAIRLADVQKHFAPQAPPCANIRRRTRRMPIWPRRSGAGG